MISYLVYEEQSGKIVRSGKAPNKAMARLQSGAEYSTYIGVDDDIRPDTHYVKDGEVISIPDRPTVHHIFDYYAKTWVDLRTIEQKQADAVNVVQEARRTAYPPLSDLGDALFWRTKGDNSKMEAYLAACEAVKTRYPKPE